MKVLKLHLSVFFFAAVVVMALSVMNNGIVSEADGAVLVAVSRYMGTDLQTDIIVTVHTEEGTGIILTRISF